MSSNEFGGIAALAYIVDGYSFRNMLGIVKHEIETTTMVLSKHAIEISFQNISKSAVHCITLNPSEFTTYEYNMRDQNGDEIPEYPIAFDTKEFFNTTKGIGRRDGIRIYLFQGDTKLNIQQIKAGAKDPGRTGALFVKIITMEHRRYEIPTYPQEPNIKVSAKDFADICGQLPGLTCSHLQIIGRESGVTFKGLRPNKSVASLNNFSSAKQKQQTPAASMSSNQYLDAVLDTVQNSHSDKRSNVNLSIINPDEILSVCISKKTVKALSKIHNISPIGTLLKFTFVEGKPTKIESPIGIYGTYTICIR
jgi:hypothetical protein